MAAALIDNELFLARLSRIHTAFVKNEKSWKKCLGICVPAGTIDDSEANYKKSASVQLFLFGLELSNSILLMTEKVLVIVASKRQLTALQDCVKFAREAYEGGRVKRPLTIKTLERHKGESNEDNFSKLIEELGSEGERIIGLPLKETYQGDFIQAWMASMEKAKLEKVDIAQGLADILVVKDDEETANTVKASRLTRHVMKRGFIEKMEKIVDEDLRVTHDKLATELNDILNDPEQIDIKVDKGIVESCYHPIIQSGGDYDIKPSAQSNEKNLSFDVILCSLGARYKCYCSNIARTFFVDPPKSAETVYMVLLKVFQLAISRLKPGKKLKTVYKDVHDYVSQTHPELLKHLPRSIGFAIGLEFREPLYVINNKNDAEIKLGMIFNLSIGFQNVEVTDTKGAGGASTKLKTFSVLVGDTIAITEKGPDVLTGRISKEYSDVLYNLENDKEEDDVLETAEISSQNILETTSRRLRERRDQISEETRAKRDELQSERLKDAMRKAAQRVRERGGMNPKADNEEEEEETEDLEAYKSSEDYPSNSSSTQIAVDMEREAVLLPINGRPVPFHISTIKNVVQADTGRERASYLRLNFYTTGQTLGKDTPKMMVKLIEKYGPTLPMVKEIIYRSLDPGNLGLAFRMIQELRKRVKQRESQKAEEADLVTQAKLIKLRESRPPILKDLTMRPQISGRKTVGILEAHENGLRFSSKRGDKVDILYQNMKHAIFQPCDNETMVILHFHLRHHIMIGKKRQADVQFYTEAVDSSVALDSVRRSSYDPDEMIEEHRDRQMKKRLNSSFKEFTKRIERIATLNNQSVEFDAPYRDLGWYGTPFREMVYIQPTVNCIICITDTPFLCIDLFDVEHIHFERVQYSSKYFDMIIIFKDHARLPQRIDHIEMRYLDQIQTWATEITLTYTYGPRSLNWKAILDTIKDDDEFYEANDKNGDKKPAGWEFLKAESDDEEEVEEEQGSDEDFESAEEEESSDFEEDESDEHESDLEYEENEELEEEGMDWDELDRKAEKEDRRKWTENDGVDERRRQKKKTREAGRPRKD